jgi:hypothetical protein
MCRRFYLAHADKCLALKPSKTVFRKNRMGERIKSKSGLRWVLKVWRDESHRRCTLCFDRRDFSYNQAALVEFGATEAAFLREDALWIDEHSYSGVV